MKKILLTLALSGAVLLGKSQIVVLNEIYTDPGAGKSEFFELYNSSGALINMDCYTIITYYTEGNKEGFYVLDLPAGSVAPTGYFVGAADSTFNVQGQLGLEPDFNWNNLDTWASSGSLTKWERSLNTYVDMSSTIPADFNDFFQKQTGSGASYHVLVYSNGLLVNAFFGGTSTKVIPAAIRNMPPLSVDMAGGCTDFTAYFDVAHLADNRGEYVTPTPGSDNGYIRQRDGQCGAWDKGSAQVQHTPGSTNGEAIAVGLLPVSASMSCNLNSDGNLVLNFAVQSGGPSDAYPVTVIIVEDLGRTDPGTTPNINEQYLPNADLGFGDTVVYTSPAYSGASGAQSFIVGPPISPSAYTYPWPNNSRDTRAFFVIFQTPQGCYDQVLYAPQCAILPVEYKSFTATRNRSVVLLKWETSSEEDSDGFAIERNNNGVWSEIAFVPSQAVDGNSSDLLTYTYNDPNNVKGITQYRIRQVDFNGRFKYSEIRAVRGEGQASKTVVFPNPTSDGRVSVVFEDGNTLRDVTLIDISGRSIRQWKGVRNNNIQIDNLSAGIYSIRIVERETGAQSVEKIVVNKR